MSELIIGRLESGELEYVAGFCKPRGMELLAAYSGDGSDQVVISLFNLPTISFFNDYAAGLEGLQGPEAATKSWFRNLPWWKESYWLPQDFDPFVVEDETFIGSSVRLLDELARIKESSAFDIAALPPRYADMREDYEKWLDAPDDSDEPLPDDDILRWIWNALHDGARISIAQNVPMKLEPQAL